MTTIVIDFKNRKIVADRQRTATYKTGGGLFTEAKLDDSTFNTELVNKIRKLDGNKYLVGAGCSSEIEHQKEHYEIFGYIDKPKDDCTIAIVSRKGDSLFVDLYESQEYSGIFGKKYNWNKKLVNSSDIITFGSGGNYAHGAFMAGCSAEEAVIAASKCDPYTSFEYDVVEL